MKFCGQCGAALGVLCPGCNAPNPREFKFCGQCGTALHTAEAQSAAPTIEATPVSRSQPAQTQRVPSGRGTTVETVQTVLEDERKLITVLFADVVGSTQLIMDRDPEEARHLLDQIVHLMIEAVRRYEGTVSQVGGDGIMAMFGAPLAHEDHAVRACCAALAMQETVRQREEFIRRKYGITVQIRVGLNSGEVVVRTIRSDLQMDYSPIGRTTHMAARMQQHATPGSIWLTAETLRLVEGFVQITSMGLVPVKGFPEPVEVFELIGTGAIPRRLQVSSVHGLTPFVGRQAEIDLLTQALQRASAGQGRVMAVVGGAGVGKSRLFYEFVNSPLTQGWLLLETRSVSYRQATAYLPMIDLLKAYFHIDEQADDGKMQAQVHGRLRLLHDDLLPHLPAYLTLLGLSVEDPEWQALDLPQRRQRLLHACRLLFLQESQYQPLLIVMENLHWIDTATQAFLDSLLDSLSGARILLLVNYRPDYVSRWETKPAYTQLRLDPLTPTSAQEFLGALVGNDAALEPLRQRLIEWTAGNPFFLEESVRNLVETGVLVGEPGAYRLTQTLQTIHIPLTVQAVLMARIDRLPPAQKRLLQSAAVIGKDIPFSVLHALTEGSAEGLQEHLMHLQTAEFLYETRLFPEREYTFKHALTHEMTYRSLLRERRQALHARIVEVMEAMENERLVDYVERLAYHAFHGEVWNKAFTYCRQAGTKAIARSVHREAVNCYEQALEALQHLPESRATREQAIDLHLALRSSLVPLGELDRIIHYLREAEALAIALHDSRRLGLISCFMINYFWVKGEPDQAIAAGQRALSLVPAVGDFALQMNTQQFLGQVYCTRGDYRQAITYLEKNVASLTGDLLQERFGQVTIPSVMVRTYLTLCLAELGTFAEGVRLGTEAIHIAEAVNHPYSLTFAYFGAGLLYLRKGELPTAIPILERGLQLCQTWNLPIRFPSIASTLGYAYALSGRVPEAVPLLERAVEQAAALGRMDDHALWVAWLSEVYLLAGRIDEAIPLAERALELSRQHNEWGHQAYALCLRGEIATHYRQHSQQAEEAYKQAWNLAQERDMRPLLGRCHYGLGTLYGEMNRRAEARTELSAAMALFRAMDMSDWLSRAQKVFAQVA